MSFAATFNVNVTFDNPAAFAGFAAAFDKLYNDFFSGGATAARKQPAPCPAPPAPHAAPAAPNPREVAAAERAAYFDSLPTDLETAPEPAPSAAADASGATAAPPDTPKRRRRTKAEMEAARAAENAPAPDLPKPHGGSNTGTTPPLPELPAEPGDITVKDGELSGEDIFELMSRVMMLEPDPSARISSEVLAPHGLSRLRDHTPDQRRSIAEAFVRLAANHRREHGGK